jgi:cell division protein FtsQ
VRLPQPTPVGQAGAAKTSPSPAPARPAARIDPRIKRRRIEVKREEGRKRLRILLGSVGAIALAVGVVGATRSPLLDVDHVVVTGAEHTSVDAVTARGGLAGHPQMIDVGTGRVARRVQSLPWVATATASRQWPATVKVVLTERRTIALTAAAGGGWAQVDATGRVLEVGMTGPQGLPIVVGIAPARQAGSRLSPAGRIAMQVAAALPPELRTVTGEVAALPDGEVELHVAPAGTIRLGDTSQLADKLSSAVTVLSGLTPKSWKVLDVRVPRAPVLTRR